MLPMAVPSVGGMCVAMLSVFVVPVLYCSLAEARTRRLALPREVEGDGRPLPQPV